MKQNKINLVKQIRAARTQQYAYLDSLPHEFQELLQDNEYANCMHNQCDLLMQVVFKDYYEDVMWFLYEFTPGKTPGPHIVLLDGTEHTFRTDDDYFKYLETQWKNS